MVAHLHMSHGVKYKCIGVSIGWLETGVVRTNVGDKIKLTGRSASQLM